MDMTTTPAGRRWPIVLASLFGATLCAAAPSAQVCALLPSGAIGWWQAENDYTDALGLHDGAPFGSVGFAAGKVGQTFSFTPTVVGGLVLVADTTDLSVGSVTVEAWIQPVTGSRFMWIVSKPAYHLYLGDDDSLHCRLIFPGGGVELPQFLPVSIGAWHHVACSWDAATGEWQMFLDGTRFSGFLTAELLDPASGPLQIGGDTGEVFFDGRIDEATVYDRALSEKEIQSIYDAGLLGDGKCPALIFADGFESGDTTAWSATVGGAP